MSYSLIGHFVDVKNKKVICSAELGFMKNLNSMRYSNKFEGITPTGTAKDEDYPEITRYTSTEFIGYYKKEFLDNERLCCLYKAKKVKENSSEAKCYVMSEDDYESHKEIIEKYSASLSLSEMLHKDDTFNEKHILLYKTVIGESKGTWFKASDFTGIKDSLKNEYESKKSRLEKLNAMKDTRDWFEMSDSARNNFLEEIGYAAEDVEDVEWKYEAITKMNNILDFIVDDMGFRYIDEDGCTRYSWKYDDEREIEIYIEVD